MDSNDTIFNDCEPIFEQQFEKSYIEEIEAKRQVKLFLRATETMNNRLVIDDLYSKHC